MINGDLMIVFAINGNNTEICLNNNMTVASEVYMHAAHAHRLNQCIRIH